MSEQDVSSEAENVLELEVVIRAPVELVWSAIAETRHRQAWWSYLDLDARPGGQSLKRWRDADGVERETRGQVLAAEPDQRLRCTWRDNGWNAETELELTLGEEGGTTRVGLRHSGWDRLPEGPQLLAGHHKAWAMHLANLRAYVERVAHG